MLKINEAVSKDSTDEEFRRLLWFLLGGSRGGENRAKILIAISLRPTNLNRLAKLLGVDYRSIQHHMGVLERNNLVLSTGKRYGVLYSIHPYLNYHFNVFEQVCNELGYSLLATDLLLSTVKASEEVAKDDNLNTKTQRIVLAGGELHQ